jgi:hypothetical protein
MLRTGLIRHFCGHITVCYTQLITPTSCQWLAAVAGKRTDARPSRAVAKTALTYGILASKVAGFLGCVQSESLPMQNEPERRTSFQYKMSLKD